MTDSANTYPGDGWVSDFVENIVGANNFVISETINNKVSTVLMRKDGDGNIDWGFTMEARFANTVIDFLGDNGVTVNTELSDFINDWQATANTALNPRFGLDVSRTLDGNNVVWIGGIIPNAVNWWIDDYDLGDLDVVEAMRGGSKLGYNLTEQRFTTLKIYSRFPVTFGNGSTNYTYSIATDDACTLIATQTCTHYQGTRDPTLINSRWSTLLPSINALQDKYEAKDWCLGIFTKYTEREQVGEHAQNQGYFYFSPVKNRTL